MPAPKTPAPTPERRSSDFFKPIAFDLSERPVADFARGPQPADEQAPAAHTASQMPGQSS